LLIQESVFKGSMLAWATGVRANRLVEKLGPPGTAVIALLEEVDMAETVPDADLIAIAWKVPDVWGKLAIKAPGWIAKGSDWPLPAKPNGTITSGPLEGR
jgi:hypothetical protein